MKRTLATLAALILMLSAGSYAPTMERTDSAASDSLAFMEHMIAKDAGIDPRRLEAGWVRREADNATPFGVADFAAPFEFPILVLANNNTTATTSVVVNLTTANVNQLFVHINNIAYNGKGRVWLNNGTAKTPIVFQESSVAVCAYREGIEGCFANNSNRNHRALLNIPANWKTGSNQLQAGNNTLVFEMTVPGGTDPIWVDHGHGYRVRFLDFVNSSDVTQTGQGLTTWDKSYNQLDQFDNISGSPVHVVYGSTAWKQSGLNGKLGDSAAIARGKTEFEKRDLNNSGVSCAHCHMSHGGDLELWQFESPTIIETALTRGKTLGEAEDIAAFIRSFVWTVDGEVETDRAFPWCSPYQPGNSMITGLPLSQTATYLRAFGSCNVLDYETEARASFIANANSFVPGTGWFQYYDIPTSLEMPSMLSWWPLEHVFDILPSSEGVMQPLQNTLLTAARSGNVSSTNTASREYTRKFFDDYTNIRWLDNTIQEKGVTGANGIRSQFMVELETNIASGYSYEDDHSVIWDEVNNGVHPLCRGWLQTSRTLFEMAPHLSGASTPSESWMYGPIGDSRSDRWANHAWYQVATYANFGCWPTSNGTNPNDYGYQVEFIPWSNVGYRYLGNALNTVQYYSTSYGPGATTLSANSGGFSNYHGIGPEGSGYPERLLRDIYNPAHSKSKKILTQVTTDGLAAFFNAYWKQMNKLAAVYTSTVDATFDKVCEPVPGYNPPVSDYSARNGGYANRPCVARGGENGKTYRHQWQQPNLAFINTQYSVSLNGGYARMGELFLPLLYRANSTPGVNKSILSEAGAWLDNMFNKGALHQNVVTGAPPAGPPPASISVTTPVSGASYVQGNVVLISTTIANADNVMIHLQKGGTTVESLPDSVGANTSYQWQLDTDQAVGEDYRFAVSTATSPGVTAYSGLFQVSTLTQPPVPDSLELGSIGSLIEHDWSNGAFATRTYVDAPEDLLQATGGTPFPLTTRDYGAMVYRKMFDYPAYELQVDDVDGPHANSYLLYDLRPDTAATSSSFGIAFYSMRQAGDSMRVRLSVRRADSGARQWLPDTNGVYRSMLVSSDWCFIVGHEDGVGKAWYDKDCAPGGERSLGTFDLGSWTPEYMTLSASPRSGASGSGMSVTFPRDVMKRRQLPNDIPTGPVFTPGTWSGVTAGANRLAIIVVPSQFYPNSSGVSFYLNDVLIDTDVTGPQEPGSGQYNMWPTQTLVADDVIKATWTDQSGVDRYHTFTVL